MEIVLYFLAIIAAISVAVALFAAGVTVGSRINDDDERDHADLTKRGSVYAKNSKEYRA